MLLLHATCAFYNFADIFLHPWSVIGQNKSVQATLCRLYSKSTAFVPVGLGWVTTCSLSGPTCAFYSHHQLHEVTACIFKQGDEKPAVQWSFLTKSKENDLSTFLRYLKTCGFQQRAKEMESKYKVTYKRLTTEPEFPRGRIFSFDINDQFKVALPLLQDKHELIGKFRCVFRSFYFIIYRNGWSWSVV